ncbi:MAG: sigma-70 family RNA polymerase sigma factor [Eubacteriales bacterium]|nr:sigma-70 family RNA polymerase sigma factor [Eubacteriales bacterium]
MDLEEQYDKIYRYCYFRLHSRELAEDVTQETFLRYFEHDYRLTSGAALRCLYTIARNLCVDVSRKAQPLPLEEFPPIETTEEQTMTGIAVKSVLSKLDDGERELLLLRYVNEVPVAEIGRLLGISRFAVYRKLLSASNRFREELRKEDLHE